MTNKAYPDPKNKIRGCLIGGAVGDALGYTVEFKRYAEIRKQFGDKGIAAYVTDPKSGKAIISDDTQMTLFTAEGILAPEGDAADNVYKAYLNWLTTQRTAYANRPAAGASRLMRRAELYARRAPGNTCLSALSSGRMGTVEHPINASKGCGGVMRVAPIAFLKLSDPSETDKLAAQAAAITHGHPLGWLPAALLVHILHESIYAGSGRTLREIVRDSLDQFAYIFDDAPFLDELMRLMKKAICASVNHNGDSDSTGAVAGNILGAYLGADAIGEKWTKDLEMFDLISEIADAF
ncbi:MAG: ADP-ribosylglycohydrolase family protein [Clostridia bacterium]|nr:ADP-ribosylglycohydrolase family protein [Clostridia bacterium]